MAPASDSTNETGVDGGGGTSNDHHSHHDHTTNGSAGMVGMGGVVNTEITYHNKGSPPPYDHALYANYHFNASPLPPPPPPLSSTATPTIMTSATPTSNGDLVVHSLSMMQNGAGGDFQITNFSEPTPSTTLGGIVVTGVPPTTSLTTLPGSTLTATGNATAILGSTAGAAAPGAGPSAATAAAAGGGASFTNTFLRGILTSIDSKDPVVANAWLETLLDAIDLLPPDIIKREIIAIAVSKGQISNSAASRKSACRIFGKVATKLDSLTLRQEVLPTSIALCQDVDGEVRHSMCLHLALVAKGVGLEATKAMILPQLVELSNDEVTDVRLAAIEAVVNLLSLLDDEACTQTIVPLVIKSCDQVKIHPP